MSHRIRADSSAKTPIERMFEKVMRRKMTPQERVYLHLDGKIKPPLRVTPHRQSRAA